MNESAQRSPKRIIAVALAALALGCFAGAPPAVALYPNGATARLPPNQVANVAGPIWKIDDRDVGDQGGHFDLLPGCHLVELTRQIPNDNYSLTSGAYFTGSLPPTLYAFRMKAGARYVIRRDVISDGVGLPARLDLSAREESPDGTVVDLVPAQSPDDIKACKDWDATRPK